MAVQHGYPRLRLERAVEHSVQVAAMHCHISVQISIPIFRKDDFPEDSRIAVETVPPAPQGQTSLLLAMATSESTQQVVCEFRVECFPYHDPMDQRALQILRR